MGLILCRFPGLGGGWRGELVSSYRDLSLKIINIDNIQTIPNSIRFTNTGSKFVLVSHFGDCEPSPMKTLEKTSGSLQQQSQNLCMGETIMQENEHLQVLAITCVQLWQPSAVNTPYLVSPTPSNLSLDSMNATLKTTQLSTVPVVKSIQLWSTICYNIIPSY